MGCNFASIILYAQGGTTKLSSVTVGKLNIFCAFGCQMLNWSCESALEGSFALGFFATVRKIFDLAFTL